MNVDFHPTGDRTEVPPTFADRLATVYDRRPATVWEWWVLEGRRMERTREPGTVDPYVDGQTRHEVRLDGDIAGDTADGDATDAGGYTPCALDALNAAAAATGRATVRSTDPVTDAVVTVVFTDESATVTPEDAVVSFGHHPHPEVDLGEYDSLIALSREIEEDAFVRSFCAYRNAFESEEAYARWAAETDAESFPARAEAVATLLHRLHRASRATLAVGILRTVVRDRLREVTDKIPPPDRGDGASGPR